MVIELLKAQCETENQQPVRDKENIIQFLKERECPVRKTKTSHYEATEWSKRLESFTYLKRSLQFPVHIIHTEKRTDIVA